MAEEKQELVVARMNSTSAEVQLRQRRQMLIALAILLLALILVLLKDWHFWFPQTPIGPSTAELERSIVTPETPSVAASSAERPASVSPPNTRVVPAVHPTSEAESPGIVASDRAVLPPLEVEVVAGRHRQPVRAASSSVRVDMQSESVEPQGSPGIISNSGATTAPVVDASETMHLSRDASQVVSQSVEPTYPLLAKQMKVQGSVVLQALIGRDGNIEDLRVLSGPAILSSAAMQAVRQWRFRPYYLAGEQVETQARITVNFTISTN
jgi:periplasmic protein TonB